MPLIHALLAVACNGEAAEMATPEVIATPETTALEVPCSLTLDRVTFALQDCDAMEPEMRQEMWGNFTAARDKLANVVGAENLGHGRDLTFPLSVNLDSHDGGGMTSWNMDCDVMQDGALACTEASAPIRMRLLSIKEDNIAHELVHALLQDGRINSQAATEGHAYGLAELIYGDEANNNDVGNAHRTRLASPSYQGVLNRGLDFDQKDTIRFQSHPIPDNLLYQLVQVHWGETWNEWEAKNPGFYKAFFTEVTARQTADPSVYLSKEVIIEIAETVTPGFEAWMNSEGPALKNMGAETGKSVQAIALPGGRTEVVQFNVSTKAYPPTGYSFSTLEPHLSGDMEIQFTKHDGTQTSAVAAHIEEGDRKSVLLEIDAHPMVHSTQGISIGGEQIPIGD